MRFNRHSSLFNNMQMLLLFGILFSSIFSSKAQHIEIATLKESYNTKDTALLDSFISNSQIDLKKGNIFPKQKIGTDEKLNELLTQFFLLFSEKIVEKTNSFGIADKERYLLNKNQFLQPSVLAYYCNNITLNSGKILVDGLEVNWGLYNLPITKFNLNYYSINTDNGILKPVILNQDFNITVNDFLNQPGFLSEENQAEHKKRADFLKKRINLIKSGIQSRQGIVKYKFDYPYHIESILFDAKIATALIQCNFDGQSLEQFFFELIENKWVLKHKNVVFTFG